MITKTLNNMECPNCKEDCWREDAHNGVGIIYGPWGCPSCGWNEDKRKVYELEYWMDDEGFSESVTLLSISQLEQCIGGIVDSNNDKEFHFKIDIKYLSEEEIDNLPEWN